MDESAGHGELSIPPITVAVLVQRDQAGTFEAFTKDLTAWWPVQSFSIGRDRIREVRLERRVGGRAYEVWHDGRTVEWGTVLTWHPPHRLRLAWRACDPPTEIEIRFQALGRNLTRVQLIHDGWQRIDPRCRPNENYVAGWARILHAFAERCDKPAASACDAPPRPGAVDRVASVSPTFTSNG